MLEKYSVARDMERERRIKDANIAAAIVNKKANAAAKNAEPGSASWGNHSESSLSHFSSSSQNSQSSNNNTLVGSAEIINLADNVDDDQVDDLYWRFLHGHD